MSGGIGSDIYFVDNAADAVVESPGQGNDAVFASVNYGLSANVENLILQGGADLQGYGNDPVNVIYGNTGNNLLNGFAGADLMVGGAGNDTYFVDDTSDAAFESPGEGNDAVFSTAHYGLAANVETLVLQGSADLQGYGNNQANTLYGNGGNNLLNGAGGGDTMMAVSATTPTSSTTASTKSWRSRSRGPMRCFPRSTSSCRRTWKPWCCREAPMPTAPATPSSIRSSAIPATTGSTVRAALIL